LNAVDTVIFKRRIGELTKYTGNASDDKPANAALQESYRVVRRMLEKEIPGIGKANEKISNFIAAKTAIDGRIAIQNRLNLIGLGTKVIGGGGAGGAIGGLIGAGGEADVGTVLKGVAIGALLGAFAQAGGSAAFKTRFAQAIRTGEDLRGIPGFKDQAARIFGRDLTEGELTQVANKLTK